MRCHFVAAGFVLISSGSFAAGGETKIHISYDTRSVRVKPDPWEGMSTTEVSVVLNANGTVQDRYKLGNGSNGETKSKLGQASGNTWKVIDENTIVRNGGNETFWNKLTVKVDGKKCSATVDRGLKPGAKFYRIANGNKKDQYLSLIETKAIRCEIE